MSRLTARGAASVIAPSEIALQDISDLESWRRGGPGGIQMLEGMHEASPDNTDIRVALAKAYNGYATLVAETDMLEDIILDRTFSSARNLATDYHARAIAHAKVVLESNGLIWNNSSSLSNLSGANQNHRDMAFLIAQSMKSMIGLRRGSAAFLSLQATAEVFGQWSCSHGGPGYPAWGCKAMHAAELAEKPVVAGGNPTVARQEFDQLIEAHPKDLMLIAMRAQFVLTKVRDARAWQESKDRYQAYLKENESVILSRVNGHAPRDKNALVNAAAAERIRVLIRHEKDLF